MTDWDKFVKVFNLDVDVQVRKEVSKADVILSLLRENEIAFKGAKGNTFVIQINKDWDLKTIKQLILNPIQEELKKSLGLEDENE